MDIAANRPISPKPDGGASFGPTLGMLRDLPLRVALDPSTERVIGAFLAKPPPAPADATIYCQELHALLTRVIDFLDAQTAKLTREGFEAGDASAVRQRVVGDPKRQVEGILSSLKQHIANEKTEWGRRFVKQSSDVMDQITRELESLESAVHHDPEEVIIELDPQWKDEFSRWFDGVAEKWASHNASLLRDKTWAAVESDVHDLCEAIGERINVRLPRCGDLTPPPMRDLDSLQERTEMPTRMESFMESFKGGLQTVAMIAGMIIVPILGNYFSSDTPAHIRAAIMLVCLLPILYFGYYGMTREREKLLKRHEDKATAKLRKDVEAICKTRLERLKLEVERAIQKYLNDAQQAILDQVNPIIESVFRRREESLSHELTALKLRSDRLQDQLMAIRQAKTGLSTQALFEVRRKLKELGVEMRPDDGMRMAR
jgi:hypothetical protein